MRKTKTGRKKKKRDQNPTGGDPAKGEKCRGKKKRQRALGQTKLLTRPKIAPEQRE